MRLTCPNCAAQYEVPEEVIPAEGRDVQCSNCGETWFQAAAAWAAEPTTTDADSAAAPQETDAEHSAPAAAKPPSQAAPSTPEREPAPKPAAAPESPTATSAPTEEPEASDEPTSRPDPAEPAAPRELEEHDEDTAPMQPDETPPVRSRSLDPALSEILREEAEREAALRAKEAESLESQPDLGLQEPRRPARAAETEDAQRGREARDRMARLRGEDPRLAAAAETGKRRELLPDIEEINSTLRASGAGTAPSASQSDPHPPAPRRRSDFARGFTLSVVAGLLLVLVYDKATVIADTLPQVEPALDSYVAWVDQARLWLDTQVRGMTTQ
ncbi:zinc-ribbon domain-containing protein [Leisingera sp. XS_AS12]|uniref:zinc-ribbon domain-containing protein n=1 Tax=Leisingera sp. XS_AS12 TaxID=3241294 RepID=UPI0035167407